MEILQIMVLSYKDKIIIENDFLEKGWSAYKICQQHEEKQWVLSSVKRLIRKIKNQGSIERKKGSGRPITACTPENEEFVDEEICSQENLPGTHTHPREIAEKLNVSHTSVRRMIKKKKNNQFKRAEAPKVDEGGRKRRKDRVKSLSKKFDNDPRKIERAVFQDEKDFPLNTPTNRQNNRVYFKGKKRDVPPPNLYSERKGQCKKLMVSAAVTWFGATKPFFVNEKGLKVDSIRYRAHLQKELFPAIRKVYKKDDWFFIQDGAPSHTAKITQEFLQKTLRSRFVKSCEWPPYSPDCNPLDYYFWNAVKEKVYANRLNKPFNNLDELKEKIKEVWSECATNTEEIRKALKQFVPRLHAVAENDGFAIKTLFG